MKKLLISGLVLLGVLFLGLPNVDAYVSVKGYYRSNGTYVAPHVRSNPNGLKYDNYGYKPSQGLYNPSYGTRGTTWDTPTYITDPDYYIGKSLYNSGTTSLTTTKTFPTGCTSYLGFSSITGKSCSTGLCSPFMKLNSSMTSCVIK